MNVIFLWHIDCDTSCKQDYLQERYRMVKLFRFRISPFFLFIIGLECLALLLSVYLGILLYKGTPTSVPLESIDRTIYTGLFLIILISILSPGFFSQVKIINKVNKSINESIMGLVVSLITMSVIVFTSNSSLDSKTLFTAAILSACVGLSVNKVSMLSKYWRFLVRSGVN